MRRCLYVAALALVGLVAAACNHKPLPEAPNCLLFPADNYWHADVSDLPLHPRSDDWVDSIGASANVHMDFGSGLWAGSPIGIPYTTVSASQPEVPIPIVVQFPFPAWATRASEAGPAPSSGQPDDPFDGFGR